MGKEVKTWFSVIQRIIFVIVMLASAGFMAECIFIMYQAIHHFNGSPMENQGNNINGTHSDLHFDMIHGNFVKILIASTALGIAAAFISMVASLNGCWSSKYRFRRSTRGWLIANFFVVILALLSFILPLCYDPATGDSFDSSKHVFTAMKGVGQSVLEMHTYTSVISEGYLRPYYVVVGLYVALSILTTLVSGFFFPCSGKDYDDIDAQSIETVSSKYD